MLDSPPGLQTGGGWSAAELAARLARGDPIAIDAYGAGITVTGALPR